MGDLKDTIVIPDHCVLNAVVGFVQEYRAEKAHGSAEKMSAPSATVLRGGAPMHRRRPGAGRRGAAGSRQYGPGYPPAGNHSLKIEEASLTGESVAVEKQAVELTGEDLPLGDHQHGIQSTMATYGRSAVWSWRPACTRRSIALLKCCRKKNR